MQQYDRGYRRNALWQMSPVNTLIIVINVLVFAGLSFLGDTTDVRFMYNHGASFWPAIIEEHEYYRLLTCTFIHFGISHLLNNMLVLAYIGDNLERALGKIKYLIVYLAAGVGSSAVSAVWSMMKDEYSVSVLIHQAALYMPFADLVDIDKEIERLTKEEDKMNKEIKRAQGMLSNPKFVDKAPADKVQAEKDKLEKYTQMLAQIQERLAALK